MPKDLVHGAVGQDVAAYVAQAADRPGQDTGLLASAVQAPGAGKPAVEKAGKLQIDASPQGQLAYVTNKATATAGRGDGRNAEHVGRLAQHRGPAGRAERAVLGASAFIDQGHGLGQRQR